MLYTAQYGKKIPDGQRYNITVATGSIFAPSWDMVKSYKETGDKEAYTTKYLAKMRESYKEYTHYWKEMVDMACRCDIVLVCYCKAGDFCHRLLLVELLLKVGSMMGKKLEYGGEICK